jgi:hypothetical protein
VARIGAVKQESRPFRTHVATNCIIFYCRNRKHQVVNRWSIILETSIDSVVCRVGMETQVVHRCAIHPPHRRLAVRVVVKIHPVERVKVVSWFLGHAEVENVTNRVGAKGRVLDFINQKFDVFGLELGDRLKRAPGKVGRIQLFKRSLWALFVATAKTEIRISVV